MILAPVKRLKVRDSGESLIFPTNTFEQEKFLCNIDRIENLRKWQLRRMQAMRMLHCVAILTYWYIGGSLSRGQIIVDARYAQCVIFVL